MSNNEKSETDKIALWNFVTINEFNVPSPPVTQKVKKGIKFIQDLFKRYVEKQESPFIIEENLQKLPDWKRNRIMPNPDWIHVASIFEERISDWIENDKSFNQPIITFVGPPYSGYENILTHWAESHELKCIEPPNLEQILSNDRDWFDNANQDKFWIFPNLERAFLRHADGLNLIRSFLDKAYSGDLGKGIIGSNSWTWAYLNHLWHGRLPNTITLQAFDQEQLAELFFSLSNQSNNRQYLFRQSDNGKYVLPPKINDDNAGESSNFLKSLAAYSRGNIGVALEYWRSSPRLNPDKILKEEDENNSDNLSEMTIWMTPWEQVNRPALKAGSISDKAIVLHAILLHNGLPYELLRDILPLSPNQIMETVLKLEEAGIVCLYDDIWQISPIGYPAVREFIQSNGYLIDQF